MASACLRFLLASFVALHDPSVDFHALFFAFPFFSRCGVFSFNGEHFSFPVCSPFFLETFTRLRCWTLWGLIDG